MSIVEGFFLKPVQERILPVELSIENKDLSSEGSFIL
jgi:hypothetical protein